MADNTTETAKCPHCFGSIDPRANICRHCNKRVGEVGRWRVGRLVIALGVLTILFGLFFEPLSCTAAGLVVILVGAAVRGKS